MQEAVQLCVELLRVLVAGICVATPGMITTSLPQQLSETWPQEESEDGLSSESDSDSDSDDVVVDMRKVLQMCDELAALMKERHMVQQAVGAAAAGHTGLTAAADTVTAIPGALGPQAAGATSASAAMAGETATACANGTSIKGAADNSP